MLESRSPLIGWFCLMEIVTLLGLIAYWTGPFRHPHPMIPGGRPASEVYAAIGASVLFVGSNALLFRHRRVAVYGFILCWLLMARILLPMA